MGNKPKNSIFTRFDGTNVPDDFEFPSINLEDIDRAVFDLFDKVINFETETNGETRKVPIVFAAGERFALTRRKNPIRDKNNALILPLISIFRGAIDISSNQHGYKTAIAFGDQTQYYVKRRLSQKDRGFQNILNKQQIKNQDNVAARKNFAKSDISPGNMSQEGTLASRRNGGNLSFLSENIDLSDSLNKNIYEIIEIPYPTFTSIKYSAIFWSQYLTQVNEIMQTLFRSFKGQAHEIAFKTREGYELVAFFDDALENDTNFENYSDEERLIKYTLNFTVPGYILNPNVMKGMPKQLRSYISAPVINFGYNEPKTNVVFNNQPDIESNLDKFTLSDIKTDADLSKENKRGESNEDLEISIINPNDKTKKIVFEKVLTRNKRAGETVVSARIIKNIDNQYE
jgi:hypothetical protein